MPTFLLFILLVTNIDIFNKLKGIEIICNKQNILGFEKVDHVSKILLAVLALHIHEHTVGSGLHGHVEKRVDTWMLKDLGHFLKHVHKKKRKNINI